MRDKFINIILDVKLFCNEQLKDEYYNLILKLLVKITREKPSLLLTDKAKTWAAAFMCIIGIVSFLFNNTQNFYLSSPAVSL